MNKTNTKRALFLSIVSLLLCFTMMLGTTFAWFTDSVNVANNRIVAGNLDVEMYYKNASTTGYEDVEEFTGESFFVDEKGNDILWEPGVVSYTNFKVVNAGNLALKYTLKTIADKFETVNEGANSLKDVIKVGVINEEKTFANRDEAVKAVDTWQSFEAFSKEDAKLLPEKEEAFTVVLYWAPNADEVDNIYNLKNGKETDSGKKALDINVDITLVATQLTYEDDSFGDDYDEDAALPVISTVAVDGISDVEVSAGAATVVVPAGAPAGEYTTKLAGVYNETNEDGNIVTTYDLSLLYNGEPVKDDTYSISLAMEPFAQISAFSLNDEDITDYDYDMVSGELTFETSEFGLFTVESETIAEGVKTENGKITAGVFKGVNPADYDTSLLEEDSEYIAINYEQNGETYYVVSKRTTTVLLAASDSVYTAENGNYEAKSLAANGLAGVLASLSGNEHSTVYLLPGSYNGGTTLTVASSMEIAGLGDKEDIKVTKAAGASSSNRHLFNVNGTGAEYIEVTIRNMTLDATEKTTNNKGNNAVQSIRKSKVKCYDLIITPGTSFDAYALCANGTNTVKEIVDGVEKNVVYPGYLYAENVVVNCTNTFNVGNTSGSSKIYHNDVFYKNGTSEYTQNSGSILNQTMDINDWEW